MLTLTARRLDYLLLTLIIALGAVFALAELQLVSGAIASLIRYGTGLTLTGRTVSLIGQDRAWAYYLSVLSLLVYMATLGHII